MSLRMISSSSVGLSIKLAHMFSNSGIVRFRLLGTLSLSVVELAMQALHAFQPFWKVSKDWGIHVRPMRT